MTASQDWDASSRCPSPQPLQGPNSPYPCLRHNWHVAQPSNRQGANVAQSQRASSRIVDPVKASGPALIRLHFNAVFPSASTSTSYAQAFDNPRAHATSAHSEAQRPRRLLDKSIIGEKPTATCQLLTSRIRTTAPSLCSLLSFPAIVTPRRLLLLHWFVRSCRVCPIMALQYRLSQATHAAYTSLETCSTTLPLWPAATPFESFHLGDFPPQQARTFKRKDRCISSRR